MIYPENIESKIGFQTIRREILSLCLCPLGENLCARMKFCTDSAEVSRLLGENTEMSIAIDAEDSFPLDTLADSTPALKALRVEGSWLSGKEFLQLRAGLASVEAVVSFFHRSDGSEDSSQGYIGPYPLLNQVASGLETFPDIVKSIDAIIDRDGNVRDSASPALGEIRRSMVLTEGSIAALLRRVIRRAVAEGVLDSDTVPSVRDGRQVIPVAPMNKRRIPGIVHDESASGKTFFIEPAEVVEANNRLRELQLEEQHEIVRILAALSDNLRPRVPEMLDAFGILGIFDFIRAKAIYARAHDCQLPAISSAPEIDWYGAFHPVLAAALQRQGKSVVKLDISLTPERRILVVSGPNAGGKSVVLKTVALVQYMLQCGLTPPLYSNSHAGVFDGIFLDIGDDQSMEDDLSTYSSHLRSMKVFLNRSDSDSLVLIDEFGSGTEPRIGGAIAEAILKNLAEKGVWGVITTHFQNLKELAAKHPAMVNGAMLYDRQRMKPLFKLSPGSPGSSFAIEIARQTGLPEDVLADVENIVGKGYLDTDRYLMDINRDRRYWENKRADIRAKEKKLDALVEKYENDALELKNKRKELLDDARRQAREIMEGSNAAIERTILEIRRSQAEKEATRLAREKLNQEKDALNREEPASAKDKTGIIEKAMKAASDQRRRRGKKPEKPSGTIPVKPDRITPGVMVVLDGRGEPGKVLSVEGRNAQVAFGNLKTNVPLVRLSITQKKLTNASSQPPATFVSANMADASRQRQLEFSREIDVRGMRAAEAVQAVTYFIDDAIQFGADKVRILHGTGTGALRQYIREYLNSVREVNNFHDEDVRFGGAGITVVEF